MKVDWRRVVDEKPKPWRDIWTCGEASGLIAHGHMQADGKFALDRSRDICRWKIIWWAPFEYPDPPETVFTEPVAAPVAPGEG